MKKVISVLLVTLFSLSLLGCAAMKEKEATRVKCPACGYEFEAPMGGQ